jgi:hypothetical protein
LLIYVKDARRSNPVSPYEGNAEQALRKTALNCKRNVEFAPLSVQILGKRGRAINQRFAFDKVARFGGFLSPTAVIVPS